LPRKIYLGIRALEGAPTKTRFTLSGAPPRMATQFISSELRLQDAEKIIEAAA